MKISTLVADPSRSEALSTARAQRVAQLVTETQMRWPAFFNRTTGTSMKVATSTRSNLKFVAERRPYDTRGIEMPRDFGSITEMLHLPIQARVTYGEEDIQILGLPEDAAIAALGLGFDDNLDGLAIADARRLEMDLLRLWHSGDIVAKNFATKAIALVSVGVDAERYETATTPLDDGAVNAWEEVAAFARNWNGDFALGGFYTSGKDMEVIRADAPTNLITGQPLGDAELGQLMASTIGSPGFRFVTDDRRFDVSAAAPDNVRTGTSKERVWPVGKLAAIPAAGSVGEARFVPVTRASDLSGVVGAGKARRDDVTVVYVTNDDDTSLEVQAQLNVAPDLYGESVAVLNTGVTA